MPLVRLEVENFKSYRGKQVIGPFRSFNSIIGPNGSGKSNLMDAISFVLGVKSSQMRSTHLKDLIFRGHTNSNFDGEQDEEEDTVDASKATVVAVYQDHDGAEHLFQRSITANGSSEYRVNGRTLSANGYNEKLKAFNILVKAKNFLVFQGDVESVASQNPKELSRLIDQISGSLEYKHAYEEAKVSQDRSKAQLAEATAKRRAITSELKHFKEQKGEADRFTILQQKKNDLVIHQLVWKLFHIDRRIQELSTATEQESNRTSSLREKAKSVQDSADSARHAQGEVAQQILDQRKVIRKKEKEAEKLQPAIDAVEQKISHSEQKITAAKDIVAAVNLDIHKYTTNIELYEQNFRDTKDAALRAAQEQVKLSSKRGLVLSDEDQYRYQELRAQANLVKANERQKLETLQRESRLKHNVLQTVQDKVTSNEEQQTKLQDQEQIVSQRKNGIEKRLGHVKGELTETRHQDDALNVRKETINVRLDTVNKQLEECLKKLAEAGSLQRESEKEAKIKETIHALKRIFPGVQGRIVDLCRPTQQKYSVALSTILGKNADAIVVDTQKDALDCIEFLKRQRAGQATFIPLDTMLPNDLNDRLRSLTPGARLAIDVTEYNPLHEKAMRYVCSDSLICDNIEIARHICYERKVLVKAVTLEGTVIHKSGLITGGLGSDVTGPRWEERQIEVLKKERDTFLKEIKELGAERYEVMRNQSNVDKISAFEAELVSLEDELSAVDKRLTGIQAEMQALKRQSGDLQPKVVDAKKNLDAIHLESEDLEKQVHREDDTIFVDFCRRIGVRNIREYEEQYLRLIQEEDNARLEYEQQMKRLEHAIHFERSQLDTTRSRLQVNEKVIRKHKAWFDDLHKERSQMRERLNDIRSDVDSLRKEMVELQREDHARNEIYSTTMQKYRAAQSELDSHLKSISTSNMEIERLSSECRLIYRRCRFEEIELPLISGSFSKVPFDDESMDIDLNEETPSSQHAVLSPDYGIKVDFSILTRQEKEDDSQAMGQGMEDRIDEAILELERITAPNAKVTHRLDSSEARLAEAEVFYERARKEVKRTQEEYLRLRKIRCDLYHRAFDHISGKVDEVYKDLTRTKTTPLGGNAYLDLQNDSEPYLEGILYTAMPPTKNFRGIDQLSGGEKSVAALALLFAIHSYRPAPFFVLDEVDAALDAQNVAQVASYIRARASTDVQFIVISLKALLYEKSEALLGVMRNQSLRSSKTLTLDLEQYA